jgi:transcriptional regulator with XRE-family HTH domain
MSAATLIRDVIERSSLSQAELARRAGLPRSVLNAYLRGNREPGADTLLRIVAAAGCKLEIEERRPPVNPKRAEEILIQVLGLAEALPYRPLAEMRYPPLAERLSEVGKA